MAKSKIRRIRWGLACCLLLIISNSQAQLNFHPPRIVISTQPEDLMLIDGPPSSVPIMGTQLEFVVNTNWDVFHSLENDSWYILLNGFWLRNSMLGSGDWISTSELPRDFLTLQVSSDWPPANLVV